MSGLDEPKCRDTRGEGSGGEDEDEEGRGDRRGNSRLMMWYTPEVKTFIEKKNTRLVKNWTADVLSELRGAPID